MGKTAAVVTFPTPASGKYVSIAAGQTLKWGYDAAKLYVSYDAVGTAAAMASTADDSVAIGVRVKIESSKSFVMACEHISAAANTSNAIWHFRASN